MEPRAEVVVRHAPRAQGRWAGRWQAPGVRPGCSMGGVACGAVGNSTYRPGCAWLQAAVLAGPLRGPLEG